MSTTYSTTLVNQRRPMPVWLGRLIEELAVTLGALLNPRRVIAEVEAMHALHQRARAIESKDPIAAARLRDEAARIGLN